MTTYVMTKKFTELVESDISRFEGHERFIYPLAICKSALGRNESRTGEN